MVNAQNYETAGKVRFYKFNDCRAYIYFCPSLDALEDREFEIKQYSHYFTVKDFSLALGVRVVSGNLQTDNGCREVTKSEYYNYIREHKQTMESLRRAHGK